MEPKYPQIRVQLSGTNGNAYALLGKVRQAMRAGGIEAAEIDSFVAEATAADYDHLLMVCCGWVNVGVTDKGEGIADRLRREIDRLELERLAATDKGERGPGWRMLGRRCGRCGASFCG